MRFSRGRSTPARRAIRWFSSSYVRRSGAHPPGLAGERVPEPAPAFGPGVNPRCMRGQVCACWMVLLALTLLVAQVFADHHDPTMATDDLALVADRLDARLDLHGRAFLIVAGSVGLHASKSRYLYR